MEGWLTKKGRVTWKRRYFTLHDNSLAYFTKRGDPKYRGQMVITSQVSSSRDGDMGGAHAREGEEGGCRRVGQAGLACGGVCKWCRGQGGGDPAWPLLAIYGV